LAGCTRRICARHYGKNLIHAELLGGRNAAGGLVSRVELLDLRRGRSERTSVHVAGVPGVAEPSDGGTLAALDFRPASATLINSMQRRQEAYHARLVDATACTDGNGCFDSRADAGERAGLEKYLRYDRWARHAFSNSDFFSIAKACGV